MEEITINKWEAHPAYPFMREKLKKLFTLKQITPADTEDMTEIESEYLRSVINNNLNIKTGDDLDIFRNQVAPICGPHISEDIWQQNHLLIKQAISRMMRTYGCMPNQKQLSQETGLSRQTVAKHLKDYNFNQTHAAEIEQFRIMAPEVLANIFQSAAKGEVKAARLYFEMVGLVNRKNGSTTVNEQTNYIQINNTILKQENLQRLTKDQLDQIEQMIAGTAEPIKMLNS